MIYTKKNKFSVFTKDLSSFRLLTYKQNGQAEVNNFKLGDEFDMYLYGKYRKVTIEKLYFMYTSRMDFNHDYIDEVFDNWELKTSKELKTHLSIPYIVRFKKPIEIIKNTFIFRILPENPTFGITQTGIVIHLPTGQIFERSKRDFFALSSYPRIRLGIRNHLIHRLIASAWVENDDWLNKVIVDHIDGNKNNFNAYNLRWVSTADNNRLKVEQGLHTQSMKCYVKNLNNGVIKEYNSITEFTNKYNISRINANIVKLSTDKPYIKRIGGSYYQVKYNNDNDWISLPEARQLYGHRAGIKYTVSIHNQEYHTLEDLSRFINNGKNYYSFSEALKDISKLIGHECVVEYEEIPDKINFIAHNVVTNEVLYAERLSRLEELTRNNKSNVYKSMVNDGAYIFNNWRYKQDDGKEFKENVGILNKPKKIQVVNVFTKDQKEFNSLREASKFYLIDKNTTKAFIRTGRLFQKKYKFTYAD